MSKTTSPKKTYELVAIVCLLPALYIQLRWLTVFTKNPNMSAEAKRETFLESFPSFFSSTTLTTISLACAVLAIIFASRSFNQPKTIWRVSSLIVVFIASIIALLSVFQLM